MNEVEYKKSPIHTSRGFTLLEVLVALALVAIAMAGVIKAVSENSSNAAYLRNKTFASIVSANKASELYVSGQWPQTGYSNGHYEMARHEWYWTMQIKKTADDLVRRIEIKVYLDKNQESPLGSLTSYLGKR